MTCCLPVLLAAICAFAILTHPVSGDVIKCGLTTCKEGSTCQNGKCKASDSCGVKGKSCCLGGQCSGAAITCLATTNKCLPCGGLGQPCCPGKSNQCKAGTCQDNICKVSTPCGDLGQKCCTGSKCGGNSSLVCSSTVCVACGTLGAPCCSGDTCSAGSFCQDKKCRECGGRGKACCPLPDGVKTCNSTTLVCKASNAKDAGTCTTCGAPGEPCCMGSPAFPAGYCSSGKNCTSGKCPAAAPACGVEGSTCCNGKTCAAGLTCTGAKCTKSLTQEEQHKAFCEKGANVDKPECGSVQVCCSNDEDSPHSAAPWEDLRAYCRAISPTSVPIDC